MNETNEPLDYKGSKTYDDEAEASNWLGPEVTFGLTYKYITTGEKILDIGIGTGLGSLLFHKAGLQVYGMDISDEMLEECRRKNFTRELKKHDLMSEPYPYEQESFHHAICLGVMIFFEDLKLIFSEVSRIIRDKGIFVFMVADLGSDESREFTAGPEQTKTGKSVTMYRHSQIQIDAFLEQNDLELKRALEFPLFMGGDRKKVLRAKEYVVMRKPR